MKTYRIRGVELCQDDLTFEEYERCKEVLRDKVNIFSGDAQKFGVALDALFEGGVLRKLMPLFLKMYEPNPWLWTKNRFFVWRTGFNSRDPILLMKGEEVAQVMLDFFLVNISWSTNLLVLPTNLNLPNEKKADRFSRMRKSLLRYPTTIFQKHQLSKT